MALTTVLLYGHLGRKYGQRWVFDIGSPAEAIRALRANCKGFEQAVVSYKPGYHVFVGKENIGEEDLIAPSGKEVIKIVPVVAGSGGFGDFFKIILGIALIVVAWPYAAGSAAAATGYSALGSAAVSMFATQLGVALILSGVSSLLAPNPTEEKKQKPAHAFDGAQNTIAQGTPVPLGYGRMRVGSAVLSAGVYADQVFAVGTPMTIPYAPGESIEGPVVLNDPYYTNPGTGY